eukprot:8478500-Lingulodinium_polyedra.AAC.1
MTTPRFPPPNDCRNLPQTDGALKRRVNTEGVGNCGIGRGTCRALRPWPGTPRRGLPSAHYQRH